LALETPALLIEYGDGRFSGLGDLTHNMKEQAYLTNPGKYDLNSPPQNPESYQIIRKDLIRRCSEYTGFGGKDGFSKSDLSFDFTNTELIQTFLKTLTNYFRTLQSNQKLIADKADLTSSVESLESELNSHLSIKRAARLTLGNIKRRILKEIKRKR
jgi:hypothetical protein